MTRRAIALKHFKRVDSRLYRATARHHASLPTELSKKRTRRQLFESLISIVISQQLGTAVADTIFIRVKKACGSNITPESILETPPAALRSAGLSGSKVKTLLAIALSVKNNELDLLSLKRISETDGAERLMRVRGLGPWSVEMFMMFALGRSDVFSAGDLGLIRAMETIYELPKGSSREVLLAISQKWSPHRTYASLLLWATRD
ncbi:hypothetical protein A3A36_00115 [Candidatus Kaiserbacteria bacterium RIFCSPLOWO2_01_FULL_52_12b]|uniref:DNA-3-methyladenine glycosylase II n=1 Tax=Candidatus Kaiserbacteria bacterium RIFCSPLOWO2_01_FULL_52_12b TaxID=1798509 RepID=A0A1F6EXE0_9BACT|nr:MAG: hypothetical protein A3A36_00115 [Candidatus Kaiserbacteria bacterium RIFCSPLOWO2_01_FULL_52_12b]